MSLTESRLTRTSASTGPGGRTQVTATSVTSARRGRALVRAVVWWARMWRTMGAALRAAAGWSAEQRDRQAYWSSSRRRRASAFGIVFGWVEWMVAGSAALLLLVASVPFLFGARSYDVDLSLVHERIVAGDGVTGEIQVRNHGRRTALPGRIDIPVGEGLIEFGIPLLRPDHSIAQPLDIPALRRGS